MLSEHAFDVGYAIRLREGSDVQGVGPDLANLLTLERVRSKTPAEVRQAIEELETHGFLRVSRGIGNGKSVPVELRDIVGVALTEALQEYFDELDM